MADAPSDTALVITTDSSRLDLDVVHGFLATSYWAAGIPREIVERAVRHSLCFGAFDGDRQVGFARVISDYATYAYISDVFVVPSHRGRGVGKQLMAAIMTYPDLQGLRRWTVFTRDAHGLYRQFGFGEPRYPERLMEILSPPYGAATGRAGTQGHLGRQDALLPIDAAEGPLP
jgi:GNAT superfamily N-acetyltransferase